MKILQPENGVGSFGKWLAYQIYISGKSITEFANDIGISTSTVNNHIKKKCRPSMTIVKIYCEYFGESDIWRVYDAVVKDWSDF